MWKFNFNTFLKKIRIFKLVKNVEAHGTCEDRIATKWFKQKEWAHIMNNFSLHIQQHIQPSSGYLEFLI